MRLCVGILDRKRQNPCTGALIKFINLSVQLTDMNMMKMFLLVNMWEFDQPSSWTVHSVSLENLTMDHVSCTCRNQKQYDSNYSI